MYLYIAGKTGHTYVIVPFSWDVFNKRNPSCCFQGRKKEDARGLYPSISSFQKGWQYDCPRVNRGVLVADTM